MPDGGSGGFGADAAAAAVSCTTVTVFGRDSDMPLRRRRDDADVPRTYADGVLEV
jgi:hypothetical protein